jgi:hypothetical protein
VQLPEGCFDLVRQDPATIAFWDPDTHVVAVTAEKVGSPTDTAVFIIVIYMTDG